MKRFLIFLLIAALLASSSPALVLGDAVLETQTPLAENVSLTEAVRREPVSGRLQSERYLLLASGDAAPAVVYGDTLYGKSTLDTARYAGLEGVPCCTISTACSSALNSTSIVISVFSGSSFRTSSLVRRSRNGESRRRNSRWRSLL